MKYNVDGRKLVVIGGSSGMGRQTAIDVVRGGGGCHRRPRQEHVDETVKTLSGDGQAGGHRG